MDSIAQALVQIGFWLALIVGGWRLLLLLTRSRIKTGVLHVGDAGFVYRMGDTLYSGGNEFRGIEIDLPKKLPHLYIDGHTADRGRGPLYTFPANYRLMLEGDFNAYFQVYALPQYHTDALTILTPDVMALLVDFAKQYDVEIFHDKLRLIDTRSKVYGKPEREAAVLSAAQALLDKLARPLERRKDNPDFWYASESMILIPDVMLKFGRHGVSSSTLALALLFGAVGLGFDVLGFWAFHTAQLNDGVTPMFFIGVGLFFFPVCWAAVVVWDKWRWARLRRLQQRADYKYKLSR